MPEPSRVSRRAVLIGGAALAVLGAASAACGEPPPPEPDPLESQLELARRDSAMAAATVTAANPFWAPVLTVVAAERADHAKALAAEIARAADEPLITSETSTPVETPSASAAHTPPPTRVDLMAALRESADSAAKLTPTLSGYRAGLVGSIAASCTAALDVPLAMKEPQP